MIDFAVKGHIHCVLYCNSVLEYGSKVVACKQEATPPFGARRDESFFEHFGGSRWAEYHQGSLHRDGEVPSIHEIR